jgi:exodeoxyribonuclease V alpha subunit
MPTLINVKPCILILWTLSNAVERITYYDPENGYTVLRLRPDTTLAHRFANKSDPNAEGLATVVGNLPKLSPGKHLRLQGQWDNHPKYGPQFKAEVCEQTLPAS